MWMVLQLPPCWHFIEYLMCIIASTVWRWPLKKQFGDGPCRQEAAPSAAASRVVRAQPPTGSASDPCRPLLGCVRPPAPHAAWLRPPPNARPRPGAPPACLLPHAGPRRRLAWCCRTGGYGRGVCEKVTRAKRSVRFSFHIFLYRKCSFNRGNRKEKYYMSN